MTVAVVAMAAAFILLLLGTVEVMVLPERYAEPACKWTVCLAVLLIIVAVVSFMAWYMTS
jgi:hypothetical protein